MLAEIKKASQERTTVLYRKHNREQYKHMIAFFSDLLLLGILTLQFAHTWYTHYLNVLVLPFFRRGNWAVIAIYAVVMFLFFKIYHAFKVGYLRRTDVFFSQVLSVCGGNLITYLQISVILRNFAEIAPLLRLTILEFFSLMCWTYLTQKLYFALYPPRKLIIVYGSASAKMLVMKMSYRVDKYMICESVSADTAYPEIVEKIQQYDGVILCDLPVNLRNNLVKFCFAQQLRAYIVPEISDIILRGADDLRLFDTPLLLCRNYGLNFEQRFCKRAFDLLFSLLAFIPVLPVMLVCALAVKLCDGGEILYKQKRLTQDGREFVLYKFRSMIPDAEKNGARLAENHDARITSVGRILRKYRLDELPQLWNILKGDMSVVGPRPERPELCEEYQKQFPEFRFRLKVKAGLTGYAQVTGVYDTVPYDKLKMDLMYIENYSFLRDIQIILMTIKIMIFPTQKTNEELEELLENFENQRNEP